MKSELAVNVLLCSKERPYYLARALSFWGTVPYQVLVSDGSDEKLYDAQSINKNTTYLHRPKMLFVDRLNELLELAQTRYVLLATDDDFVDSTCIETAVNFLDRNPDYSCTQGLYIRFGDCLNPASRSVNWRWDYVYSRNFNFCEEHPKKRIAKALKHPVMHYCYSVMRKQHLQKSLELLRGVDLSCPSIFELSFLIVLMASGKYATLPLFYSARQAQLKKLKTIEFSNWINAGDLSGSLLWMKNIENFLARESTQEKNLDITSQWLVESINQMFLSKSFRSRPKSRYIRIKQTLIVKYRVQALRKISLSYLSFKRYMLLLLFFWFDIRRIFLFLKGWSKMKHFVRKYPVEGS